MSILRYITVVLMLLLAFKVNAQSTRELLQKMQGQPDSVKMRMYESIATTFNNRNIDSAILFLTVAQDYADNLGLKKVQSSFLNGLGYLYLSKGSYQSAISIFNKAISEAGRSPGGTEEIANAYTGKGHCFLDLSDYNRASESFFTALNLYEHLGDSVAIPELMDQVGKTMEESGNFDEAKKYFRNSLGIRERTGNRQGMAASLDRFGEFFLTIGKVDSALASYRDAFNIGLLLKDSLIMYRSLLGMADIQMVKKEWNAALNSLRKAENVNVQFGDISDRVAFEYKLGKTYFKSGEPLKGDLMLQHSLDQATELGMRELVYEITGWMADELYSTSNYKKAFHYLQMHKAYGDTIALFNNLKSTAEARVKYEDERAERELKIAEKAKKLGEQNERQIVAIWWIVIISMLAGALTIAGLLYVNHNRKRANKLLRESLKQKEQLLKEFHYRVKNNLQLVYSLLNLQKGNVKDQQAAAAIVQAQNRIRSMGLVHENLYVGTKLGHVDFQKYLNDLINTLKREYLDDDKNVKVSVSADNVNLRSDASIPLGLIINELVSNAFKYAYQQRDTGSLWISLSHKSGTMAELEVRDSGPGLPAEFSFESVNTLGLELVQILAIQLGGEVSYKYKDGASFIITFDANEQKG